MFSKLYQMCQGIFNNLSEPFGDFSSAVYWFQEGIQYVVILLAPLFVSLFIGSLLISFFQVGFMFSTEPLIPKWKKINLFDPENYKKFFNAQALMRLIFGIGKLAVILVVSSLILYFAMPHISQLMNETVEKNMLLIFEKTFFISLAVAIILLILGIGDLVFQKWKYQQDMKMTKQEVKDERKQTEGDVHIRSKMRSMMQAFAQSRMKTNVPQADVIIANPTHYAIALKYDPKAMGAPLCVAKGMRKMAEAIKEIAREHKIPIVENPPLAQGLYRFVEVGSYVPPNFYHAVAEVLAYIYRISKKMKKK